MYLQMGLELQVYTQEQRDNDVISFVIFLISIYVPTNGPGATSLYTRTKRQ